MCNNVDVLTYFHVYSTQFHGCPGIVLSPSKSWYFEVCQLNLKNILDDSNRKNVYCARICEYVTEKGTKEKENNFLGFFLPHQNYVNQSKKLLFHSALLFKSVNELNVFNVIS